ncbi:hypothetical protein [Sinorhizobium fredii]|uniref:hypothetical protein n=1 Tax=Rhizobium fredii TaxID=380 RepID=UPI0035139F84
MAEIDHRVSASLHPDNVKQINGYDDETAPVLAPTMTAFSEAYEGIRAVHNAREKAKTNPTWNEAQQIIATDDFAQKQFARIAKVMDSTRVNLEKGIEHLEKELSQPLESKAAQGIASEIRAHVKGLSMDKRHALIRGAIEQGDHMTVSAVLGTVPYLSGLDAQFQAIYTRQWNEKASPATAKRLRAMVGARELIEQRAGLVFGELEKAVGAPPHKAKALREAKTAAEKAFILKDA